MRHKTATKIKKSYLKYIVIDKTTGKATIYHYKKAVADALNVSARTLDRQMPYKNDSFEVYLIVNVVL